MKKEEEITIINKSTNGYVKWGTFTWVIGAIIAFAGFVYAIRVDSSDKQFANEDAKIQALTDALNSHQDTQTRNELETQKSLGRIEQALGIKTK